MQELAAAEGAQVLPICAALEEEISSLDEEEKQIFLQDIGLEASGLDRMVSACYTLLGLISYLTAGEDEVRAWTIVKGTKAPAAAGKIHSDFERGFIRAETVAFDDLMQSAAWRRPGKRPGPQRGQGIRRTGWGCYPFPL